jgi:hypothetical protein
VGNVGDDLQLEVTQLIVIPALLSRQFRAMPRSRVDGLLASFPKLIPVNSQHTTVETADVRFVYQPFEELYVLLITNKSSNILQVSAHLI